MRALSTIPPRPRATTAPSPRPAGRLARARRAMQEMSPDAIEQIAQRVAQLLRHEPDSIDEGPSKPPELVDAEELAKRFRLTRGWVYENAALLEAIPLSDGPRPRLRFDPEVVARVLKSRRRHNKPVPVSDSPQRPRPTRRRRTPSTVPLLPIHEPRTRGLFTRWRPTHQKPITMPLQANFPSTPRRIISRPKQEAPRPRQRPGQTLGGVISHASKEA
jgi:hypothetical protein